MTLFSDRDERFAENLRIINSRFLRKKPRPVRGERVSAGGGGAPTVVFAPSNSSQYSKNRADFLLTGVQDLARIQLILDEVAAEGVTGLRVLITEGNVRHSMLGATTDALRLKGDTTLLGMGQFATGIVLEAGSPASANLAVISTFGPTAAIQDLYMNANTISTNPPHLILTTNTVALERLYLANAPRDAIWCGSGANPATILHVYIETPGRDGLSLSSTSIVNAFSVYVVQAERYGFFSSVSGGVLEACRAFASLSDGFHLAGFTGSLGDCTADSAEEGAGIYAEDCSQLLIHGGRVVGAGKHGIHFDGVNDSSIAHVTVVDAGVETDNTFDGIFLEDSDYNSIQANRIRSADPAFVNASRYGINVSNAACNNNVVNGNVAGPAGDFGTGAYNDAGTGTQGANFTV